MSVLDFRDWQRQASSFDGMALYRFAQLDLPGEAGTERVQRRLVTPEFYDVGLSPALDQLPIASSEASETDVVILGGSLWSRRGTEPFANCTG